MESRGRSINGNSNNIWLIRGSQYDHLLSFVQNKNWTKSNGVDARQVNDEMKGV